MAFEFLQSLDAALPLLVCWPQGCSWSLIHVFTAPFTGCCGSNENSARRISKISMTSVENELNLSGVFSALRYSIDELGVTFSKGRISILSRTSWRLNIFKCLRECVSLNCVRKKLSVEYFVYRLKSAQCNDAYHLTVTVQQLIFKFQSVEIFELLNFKTNWQSILSFSPIYSQFKCDS